MNSTLSKQNILYILLFGMLVLLHFSGIGKLSIYALDEAKNAVAAYEMLERNDFILPTFNDQPRFDKPPLHYYFFMAGYKLFGYSPFGARFFPALAGLFCIGMCAAFLKKQFGDRATIFYLLLSIANIHWMIQFHMAVPDPFLISFLTVSYLYGFRYYQGNYQEPKLQYISYAFLALATLTKGPVAILLYTVTFLAFIILKREFRLGPWFRIGPIVMLLAIASSWYILVGVRTGGNWLEEFFLTHNLSRFGAPMEGHGGLFLKTWLFVALGIFPFVLYIPAAFRFVLKSKKEAIGQKPDVLLFASIASVAVIVFFSFASTRLPNYTTPAYPWLMILLAIFISDRLNQKIQLTLLFTSTILVLGLGIGGSFGLAQIDYIKDIHPMAYLFLIALIPLALSFFFTFRKKLPYAFGSLAFSLATVTLIFLLWVMPAIDKQNPVFKTQHIWEGQENIYYYGIPNPSFVFYLQRPIPLIDPVTAKTGDLIITRKSSLQQFEDEGYTFKILTEANDLFETPITVIVQLEESPR
ncbi:glycosyltransferase family 39 protein [Belliella sp. DSM 111904]|uniref:Glycosyltransferase family 39 protein n=1 Tax=Belliella filtrata TaxID=2923435 RepID=A0ABS9V147_9BACT|nr:glycosyltransferase family 39 protein [Belliella filtrata]MCH7410121.1 glycosyltransferase family 39 protein [Belliella filtrata]